MSSDNDEKNESRALSYFYLAKNLRFVNILLSHEMHAECLGTFSFILEKENIQRPSFFCLHVAFIGTLVKGTAVLPSFQLECKIYRHIDTISICYPLLLATYVFFFFILPCMFFEGPNAKVSYVLTVNI